ncbi:MAG: competence/damage-inducible protein A [Bacteroidales bacterium]|nr:competence/damage-inducible protein A [Bacteroidales bacterium]
MKADIITIGDEILIGHTIDSNSAFIAFELNSLGINVYRIYSIADRKIDIIITLDEAIQESDIIIITGGLGPTNDDITKKTLMEYFGGTPVLDEFSMEYINKLLKARGIEATECNIRQAEVPDTCTVLRNRNGSAPGMLFKKNDKTIISLPGVPYEMKGIMYDEVIPYLTNNFSLPVIIHKTILTAELPESGIADILNIWEKKLDNNTRLAYLPSPGIVKLRISISGNNKDQLKLKLNNHISYLSKIIGPKYIFGYDDDSLESVIGELLRNKKKTVSTVESCTGGNIAHRITGIPGSSDYFIGSVVAYSNSIKKDIVGVPRELISNYGAVSKYVVEAMSVGIREKFSTDFGIATSGIAGPGGGTKDKPVGTTWLSVSHHKGVYSQVYQLGDHRGRNIEKATIYALNMLRNAILEFE